MVDCTITKNIDRPCKDLQGGIARVVLFPYEKYTRSQITIVGQEIQTFPTVTVFSVYSVGANFTETTQVDGGAVSWKQNFTIDIPKSSVDSEVYRFVNKRYRAMFIDRNNNVRMLGLYNGLEASITEETGSDKGSFSGNRVTFEGQEDRQAQYYPSFFLNYGFEDGSNYIFQDFNNYIFNS